MELLLLQSPPSNITCLATSATLRSRASPTQRLASSSSLSFTFPKSFNRQTLSTHCLSSPDVSNAEIWKLENDAVCGGVMLFPNGNTKHWLVRIAKPNVRVVTKAQMVDYCVQLLTKVMGNEMDAQMCLYHVSWQSDFGFCCELDEECAKELAGVPGVLSVQPDDHFESQSKNYKGEDLSDSLGSSDTDVRENITTKKLFVTGLSFYTSEKTLRAAFESFGELVEVKIIMDKISKRSKGYAFIEYTTVESAGAALNEMNGKIINGWMIVVDVAKTNPPRYSRGREMS